MDSYGNLEKPRIGHQGPAAPDVERPRPLSLPTPQVPPSGGGDGEFVDEILAVTAWAFRSKARSESTRSAYQVGFRHFEAWCAANGRSALPASPETVGYYLAAHGDQSGTTPGLAVATLEHRLVCIASAHKSVELETPTRAASVRELLQGIRREAALYGRGAPRKATPLLTEDMRALVESLDTTTLIGKRDKALLLLEWTGAFRSGEIGTIHVGDMQETGRGYLIQLRKSKTDQGGKGQRVAIPVNNKNKRLCPVLAIKDWLVAAAIKVGPVIRPVNRHGQVGSKGLTRRGIHKIVKRAVAGIDYDPSLYSGHSLRAGLATSAALSRVPDAATMAHGRWKSKKVYLGYVQVAELFNNNPANLIDM